MLRLLRRLLSRVALCRSPRGLPPGTVVFFPLCSTRLACGLAGIVEVVPAEPMVEAPETARAERAVFEQPGGEESIAALTELVVALRRPAAFPALFGDEGLRSRVRDLAARTRAFVAAEEERLFEADELPDVAGQEEVNRRLVSLKDAAWALDRELLANVERVSNLLGDREPAPKLLLELRKANLILNALDRLEIRGRDSAGVLFQVSFPTAEARVRATSAFERELQERQGRADLPDGALALSEDGATVTLVYKVAAEVGRLGDNVAVLREAIRGDDVLGALLADSRSQVLVTSHTRWASNGIINLPNCHPLDNECIGEAPSAPHIHVALNGDIDNYLALRERFEEETGRRISERITTDAKVIALWVERYLARGHDLPEAFRRAVGDFEGSAAVFMTSDLMPGRLFCSLRGSGQSLYTGLSGQGYLIASEIYGLVEETRRFIKVEGEAERIPGDESTRGQVFCAALDGRIGPEGLEAVYHDGTPLALREDDVRTAEITTRDVDRGEFPHYFLKEISQGPESVAKTIRGKFSRDGSPLIGPDTISLELDRLLAAGELEKIVVVGQGTASVAAMGVREFVGEFLKGSRITVETMKASELSGFGLTPDMSRTLIVPVTQSGATADTNRAVDLARERGARTLAIVNRRNSDVTFKTEGVLYTSDGRDVEMSVASTKAFYSQVVAGALLGLALGLRAGTLSQARVLAFLDELEELPRLMREVAALGPIIAAAAERTAPTRRYWTVVGSGPNRIAAEEVRIKLSELCYKSISADSVEDKKHIDLSSESLILVLAAGHEAAVLADLAKDVAIFKAHRALPVVVASRGERRFDSYAAERIEIPPAPPLLSMILSTMVGHLFGYHAARAIDEGSSFLGRARAVVVDALDLGGLPSVRDMDRFSSEFTSRLRASRFASALEAGTAADLSLLLKCAAGAIPPSAIAEEPGRTMEPAEIQAELLGVLVEAVDQTSRPIDAIKHQAKIVTVGTSRTAESPTGPIFDALMECGVEVAALTFFDRVLLRDAQLAVSEVAGITRYELSELEPGAAPGPHTRIRVLSRTGSAAAIDSRAEGGAILKGTKRTVVRERRAFVGVGARDGRRLAIVPLVDHRFTVTGLALLHLEFKAAELSPADKRAALGDRYDLLVNQVAEADVPWSDDLLERFTPEEIVILSPATLAARLTS